MTIPTARSTTFPRNRKALNPLIDVPPQSCPWGSGRVSQGKAY
jgi:hypothetical protein